MGDSETKPSEVAHVIETPHEDPRSDGQDDQQIFMRFGDVEFRYSGSDLEGAWENAKAAIDTYLEVRDP